MGKTEEIRAVVEGLEFSLLSRPLAELGMLGEVEVSRKGDVELELRVPVPNHQSQYDVQQAIVAAAGQVEGIRKVAIDVQLMTDEDRQVLMERLKTSGPVGGTGSRTRVIAVGSGKGGVGKSSVTTNVAVALAEAGHSVGVMDADVWGFSIPKMLGAAGNPAIIHESIVPPVAHGVKAMSMEYFVGEDQAVIWRGPMLHKAVEQFLTDVFWDDPEFLLIDMPPGTGDIAISLSQFLPRAQMLLVTTPQPTAQRVARRAALMAQKVNQDLVGVVENMSWFTGDDGTRYEIFGSGGGWQLAEELEIPLLGEVPLVPDMREGADEGRPVAEVAPDSEAHQAFREIAAKLVDLKPRTRTHPELVIR